MSLYSLNQEVCDLPLITGIAFDYYFNGIITVYACRFEEGRTYHDGVIHLMPDGETRFEWVD
jgi:hypothetical protein